MPLTLNFRVNQGVSVKEIIGKDEKTVDVVVRKIIGSSDGTEVSLEIYEGEKYRPIKLRKDERYDVLPHSTLHVNNAMLGLGRNRKISLTFYSPRSVEISRLKLYPERTS